MPKKPPHRPKRPARARLTIGATKRARAARRTKDAARHTTRPKAKRERASTPIAPKTPVRSNRRHTAPAKISDSRVALNQRHSLESTGTLESTAKTPFPPGTADRASQSRTNDASPDLLGRHRPAAGSSAELGLKDYRERYSAGARVSRGRGERLRMIWAEIRKGDEFTVPTLSRKLGASKNYVKIYVRALRRAGYLVALNNRWGSNPHNPTKYKCGPYRGEQAPQLAGGSGKTGKLGRGWKTIEGT